MYSADVVECYQGNLGLVHQIARKCYGRLQQLEASTQFDDVFADTREAFLLAHRKFDPALGFAFSTYFTRAAYNRINKIAEVDKESRENGVFSFEDLSGDENLNATERIASDAMTPEEMLERQENAQQVAAVVKSMSPVAALIVEWLVSPPAALLEEIQKHQAHCDYSRSIGIGTRCAAGLNIGFICKFMRVVLTDVSQNEIARAGREVRRVIDTL